MTDYAEIQIGCERNEAGEPLIRVGGILCGTVEGFKRLLDSAYRDEALRKAEEAGVRFTMTDGVPKISVPASAAHMVDVEGYYPKNEVNAAYSAITDSLKLASEIQDLRRRRSL